MIPFSKRFSFLITFISIIDLTKMNQNLNKILKTTLQNVSLWSERSKKCGNFNKLLDELETFWYKSQEMM